MKLFNAIYEKKKQKLQRPMKLFNDAINLIGTTKYDPIFNAPGWE